MKCLIMALLVFVGIGHAERKTEFGLSYSRRTPYELPNPTDYEVKGSVRLFVADTLDFGAATLHERQNGKYQTGAEFHGFVMGKWWKAGFEMNDPANADWFRSALTAGARLRAGAARFGLAAVREFDNKSFRNGVWMGRGEFSYSIDLVQRLTGSARGYYDYGKDRRAAEIYAELRYRIAEGLYFVPFYRRSSVKRSDGWETTEQGKIALILSI